MKKYNKKILILSSMLLLIGAGFLFFWTEKTSKTNEPDIVNKVLKEESYLLYVKINPVVKLSIDISYYLCDKELCSDYSVIVSKIDLLNEDAQKIYKDLDVIKKDLNKVMKELVTVYLDTNEKNEKVVLEVFTDWQKYDEYEFDLDKDKTNLEVRYEKDINVEELLQEAKKEYTITFDSNGGSKVENQIILENEKVIKPQDPNRKNYTFVEWLYNDKSYDFSIEVTKNMTLKAKWRKNKTESKPNNNIDNIKEETNNNKNNKDNLEVVDTIEEDTQSSKDVKYGLKLITITTTRYDVYSDGSKVATYEESTSYNDYSDFNATTEDLMQDAINNKSSYRSWINEALSYTNDLRAEVELDNLVLDEQLTTAAMIRALEMCYSDIYSHTRPNGTDFDTIYNELNISAILMGENLVKGMVNPRLAINAWRSSHGHYKNMIFKSYDKIGIGVCKVPYGEYYWVQLFKG